MASLQGPWRTPRATAHDVNTQEADDWGWSLLPDGHPHQPGPRWGLHKLCPPCAADHAASGVPSFSVRWELDGRSAPQMIPGHSPATVPATRGTT